MSEASKALAEVRGWLCGNLDASDAGHVCGILSVVSRRVVQADELESENAKLRELAVLNWEWAHSCCGSSCKVRTEGCGYGIDRECNYEREIWYRMRELGVEVDA